MPRPDNLPTASDWQAILAPVNRAHLASTINCTTCDGDGEITVWRDRDWTEIPCTNPDCIDGRIHPEDNQ